MPRRIRHRSDRDQERAYSPLAQKALGFAQTFAGRVLEGAVEAGLEQAEETLQEATSRLGRARRRMRR